MWRSDEGVAPYRCLCQSKQTDKPKFEIYTFPTPTITRRSSTAIPKAFST